MIFHKRDRRGRQKTRRIRTRNGHTTDADIVAERRVTRRSLLGALGLGAGAAATVILAVECAPAADASRKKKKAKQPAKKPKEEETDKD
jgi:ferric-dicitrate binding protein FerR (iron transport regulator)